MSQCIPHVQQLYANKTHRKGREGGREDIREGERE
jgi:hypothetical protein